MSNYQWAIPEGKKVLQFQEGQIVLSSPGKNELLFSEGFAYCNVFLLRDRATGDSAMFHFFPRKSQISAENPINRGLNVEAASQLQRFIDRHDDIVGISLHNGAQEDGRGGENDHGLTNTLSDLGVKMFRHNIPAAFHIDTSKRFNAIYDPNIDELRLHKHNSVEPFKDPLLVINNFSQQFHDKAFFADRVQRSNNAEGQCPVTNKNVVEVKEGEVAFSSSGKNAVLTSKNFRWCNLFLLRADNGDVAFVHYQPREPERTDVFERGLGQSDDEKAKFYAGELKDFIASHTNVKGISLYNNVPHLLVGGTRDYGMTQELERLGVKMMRHKIGDIVEKTPEETEDPGFDVRYEPDNSDLNVMHRGEHIALPMELLSHLQDKHLFVGAIGQTNAGERTR